jgi:hypothetical protein
MESLVRRAWDWLRRKVSPKRNEEASLNILIRALDRLEGRYYALRNGVPIGAGERLEPGDRIEIIGIEHTDEELKMFRRLARKVEGLEVHEEDDDESA